MDNVLKTLTRGLDHNLKAQVASRVDVMIRELRYLEERRDDHFLFVQERHWPLAKLELLCVLNSFYQVVLGPLASSARDRSGHALEATPILHGSIRFDRERAAKIKAAHGAFTRLVRTAGVDQDILAANHSYDLVLSLRRFIQRHDSE